MHTPQDTNIPILSTPEVTGQRQPILSLERMQGNENGFRLYPKDSRLRLCPVRSGEVFVMEDRPTAHLERT